MQPDAPIDLSGGQQFNEEAMHLLSTQSWGVPSGQAYDYYRRQAENDDEQVISDGGNGLFWLWNDTWDGSGNV